MFLALELIFSGTTWPFYLSGDVINKVVACATHENHFNYNHLSFPFISRKGNRFETRASSLLGDEPDLLFSLSLAFWFV